MRGKMARVLKMEKRGSGYLVTVSQGDEILKLQLDREKTIEYGILRGGEIEENILDALVFERDLTLAKKKALSILSYGDKSRGALYDKLLVAGYSDEVSRLAVEYVLSYGYIDEERQVESAVLRLATRDLRSKRYIIAKLLSEGYDESLVEGVIDTLTSDGRVDFSVIADELAEKMGVTGEEKQKLLYKRGFIEEDF